MKGAKRMIMNLVGCFLASTDLEPELEVFVSVGSVARHTSMVWVRQVRSSFRYLEANLLVAHEDYQAPCYN